MGIPFSYPSTVAEFVWLCSHSGWLPRILHCCKSLVLGEDAHGTRLDGMDGVRFSAFFLGHSVLYNHFSDGAGGLLSVRKES